MSIDTQTLGLITDKDVLSLAVGLRLVGSSTLVDEPAGARHKLSAKAHNALKNLRQPIAVRDWQRRSGLSDQQAMQLILFLDSIAGLSIKRKVASKLRLMFLRFKLMLGGIKLTTGACRFEGNYWGITLAVARALTPVSLTLVAVLTLGYLGGVFGLSFAIAQILMLVTVLVTTLLHESVHLYFARRVNLPAVVIARRVRVGVLHPMLPPNIELVSALLGPISGIIFSSIIAIVLHLFNYSEVMVGFTGIVAVFHVFSWVPEYGDGATIKRYMGVWHEKKA